MKKNIIILLILTFSILFCNKVSAASSNIYNIFTDNDGIRWEYKYENTSNASDLYIAFYDKPSSITYVTVPSLNTIKLSNTTIPNSIKNIILTNYFPISGQTPKSFLSNINTIDLRNLQDIEGISPMINNDIETTIIFSTNGAHIGDNVFANTKLNLINLPLVKTIGEAAFKNATLNDPNLDLNNLLTIGDSAFYKTNIETVTINTASIANNAFGECTNLTKVTLGEKVTTIGDGTFQQATKLTTINFNNVKSLGNYAFKDCTSFNTDISNTKLENIGDGAFYNTPNYKLNITIPPKVTTINYATFYGSGIISVNLNNVTKINSEAFSNCPRLSNIDFGHVVAIDYRAFYNDINLTKITLSDSVEHIMTQAFSNCSINSLNLNKIQRIDYEAFANNKLEKIYLPKTFNYMTESNIFNNNNITTVTVAYDTMSSTMPTNFRTLIGSNYQNITTLYVIAPYGENESAIIKSNYGAQRKTYTGYFNADAKENYGNANSYKNVIEPGYFYGLPSLTNVIISEGYEFIGSQAFYTEDPYTEYKANQKDKYKLTSVILPSTLKGIGSMAFAANIVSENFKMNLPENLEYIGYQAFFNCPGFTNEINLKKLKMIGTNAFMYSKISAVYLYDNLTFVGAGAFKDCYNIKKFYIDCDLYKLPYSGDYGYNSGYTAQNFYSYFGKHQTYDSIIFTEKVITEPCGGFDNYASVSFMYRLKAKELILNCKWKKIGVSFLQEAEIDKLTLPKELQTIMKTSFHKAKINNLVEIPDTVTTIENDAFHSANLKINQLPKNLKFIGKAAFYNCDFNNNPVVPSSVTYIGTSAFMSTEDNPIHRDTFTFDCNLKSSVTNGQTVRQMLYNTTVDHLYFTINVTDLPSSETKDSEFYSMPVKTATFAGLKILPAKAFQNCQDLTKVDFSADENLEAINDFAFYNAENLSTIKFPSTKTKIITLGESSFRNTGFKTVGAANADFDLTAATFIANSKNLFSESKKLVSVDIPNNFNNNEVPSYMFYSCPNLQNATINYKIKKINSYAFSKDTNLESIIMWGDAKIIQEDEYSKELNPSGNSLIIYNKAKTTNFNFSIIDSIKGTTTIKPNDFTTVNEVKKYTYLPTETSKVKFTYPENINITIEKVADSYQIIIEDFDPSAFTIPSSTDIYAYSTYDIKNWDKTYAKYRRNSKYNTNSTLYALDEVLYLTSNKKSIIMNKKDKDFDKKGLIVYALRRDGIILESVTWHQYTSHYLKTNSNIIFEDLNNLESPTKAQKIYITPVPTDIVDISTENFATMTYDLIEEDNLLHTKKLVLYYTDKYTENDVDTKLKPSLIGEIVDTGSFLYIGKLILPIIIAIILIIFANKRKKLYKI